MHERPMSVAFVFTNPRHHLDMMSPVARELERRGIPCRLISLAELRGFDTPRDDARLIRAIPLNLRRKHRGAAPRADEPAAEPIAARLRRTELARRWVWRALDLRLRGLLQGARVVVVPNDLAYPYRELVSTVHARGARCVLMQEGIRFPLPGGAAGPAYGSGGAAAICAWGEGSRDYFLASGVPEGAVAVTGSPRFDAVDREGWLARGRELRIERGLAAPPLAFVSNPIEQLGYGSKQDKLALIGEFFAGAAPILRARGVPLVVTAHAAEDPAELAAVAAQRGAGDLVTTLADAPIHAVLGAARAVVVLTSTVGLEALMLGVPIAQLEIPGQPFAFEYVARGAAAPLRLASLSADLEELLARPAARREAGAAFVARHLHDLGRASGHVASAIERVLAAP
jgi:hypothetical protein